MKIAKASQADMDAAIKITSILEAIDRGFMPTDLCGEDSDEWFESDNPENCMRVIQALIDAGREGSLSRVTWGMYVLLDPANKVVDPNADTIEHHPERQALEADNQKLTEFAKSFLDPERHGFAVSPYIRDEARKMLGIEPVELKGEASQTQPTKFDFADYARIIESRYLEALQLIREVKAFIPETETTLLNKAEGFLETLDAAEECAKVTP